MQKILNAALRNIRPTPEEKKKMDEFVREIIKISTPICKEYSAKPVLCGSVTKNTWLSNKNEIDLFILFNTAVNRNNLEKFGLAIAKEIFEKMNGAYEMAYAEHPYLKGMIKFNNGFFNVDIVPCYELKDARKIITAVDRTPHHVEYVKKNLKIPDEARLLKQFAKANGFYGADVKTQGFSGYLCELLIINHGKFSNLVKEAANWRAPIAINLDNDINKEKAFKEFKSPLIVIDPVDPKRNVAAAVSIENFYKFVEACAKFMKTPSEKFFEITKNKPYNATETLNEIKKRGTRWYLIEFERPAVIEDTLWPQLSKGIRAIETMLEANGFKILRKDFWCDDKCIFTFEMDTWSVPKIIKNVGPNVYSKHAEDFLKHYKSYKTFIEGDSWVVEKQREFLVVSQLLKHIIDHSETDLLKKGIPTKIVKEFKKAKIYSGADFVKKIKESPDNFRLFMRNWFEKDIEIV